MIASYFYYGNPNSEQYLEFLETTLTDILGDVPFIPCMSKLVLLVGLMSNTYKGCRTPPKCNIPRRWIETKGSIPWPPQ